jgi:hypothetical protein
LGREVDSSCKYIILFVFNATWLDKFAGKLLKIQYSFGITGLNCAGVPQEKYQCVHKTVFEVKGEISDYGNSTDTTPGKVSMLILNVLEFGREIISRSVRL